MIETVVVYGKNGSDSLTLTLTSPETSQGFALVDMTGLGPGQASVSTSDWVTIPGSKITSVRIPKRTITMQLRFMDGRNTGSIADIRRRSYTYFPLGEERTLEITDFDYYTGRRQTFLIDGVVSRNEPAIWSAQEGANIEFICGDPMFRDKETENFSLDNVKPLFHFLLPDEDQGHPYPTGEILDTRETSVNVKSLVQIGATIILQAYGEVVNPVIYNRTTNEVMILYYTMKRGDVIKIDTRPGYKAITLQTGLGINLINYLSINSEWVTLRRGTNVVGVRCDKGVQNLGIQFTAQPLYVGI